MDFELRQAKEKWEREQREKKEKARVRAEKEKKAKEEAAKRKEAIETAQIARRLEEAGATLDAQQRQEEAMWLGDGVVFDKELFAVRVEGIGDKIRLPASAFAELQSQNAIDKGPMFFKISALSGDKSGDATNDSSGDDAMETDLQEPKSTHSGVLEFTAREGEVEMPPHVWDNTGLSEVPLAGRTKVNVCYVRLPKGTYAKLRPENADFVDVQNHKAVLETKLRQHATLSVGDLLTVQHGGVDYGLRVMELKPASSVSVLETDLEADIVRSVDESEVGTSAHRRLLPLELEKVQKDQVSEGEYRYYKFTIDEALGKSITAGELSVLVHLDVEDSRGSTDADIYVGAHPLAFPTQHNHEWSSHDKGSKVIVLSSGRPVGAGSYSIGVHGFAGTTKFQLLVDVKRSVGQGSSGNKVGSSLVDRGSGVTTSSGSSSTEDGFGKCDNCAQLVPLRTFALHEAYCRRHNVVCKYPNCGIVLRRDEMEKHEHCEKCGQAFQKEDLAKHVKVFHEPLQCTCGVVLEMEKMVTHRSTVCPHRQITCRFCGDMVQAGSEADNVRDRMRGLTQHESSCGSRTAPCDTCSRAIMLKEMDLHMAAAHGGASQSAEVPTSNIPSSGLPVQFRNDGGTVPPSTPTVQIRSIECPICSKQFPGNATWQLNQHIDSEHLSSSEETAPTHLDNPVVEAPGYDFPPSTPRRTLSVACPICGMAVHSERDLSSHIDMVH